VGRAQLSDNVLRAIAEVLGDTGSGLTGSEIGRLISACGLTDPGPITKRERIYQALADRQRADGSPNNVLAFVLRAMDPVRYRGEPGVFEARRTELNVAMAFAGLRLREDGQLEAVPAAATLSEAQQRANRLRAELMRRGVAADVLRFCQPELLEGNYFHAVFEATKSVAQKLRDRTGLTIDGSHLVDEALGIDGGRTPLLAWNTLTTTNDRNEHQGVVLMMRGVFAYFRNLPAHIPKAFRVVTEQEALELMTIASFLHRRLDAAVSTSPSRLL
jgi:uncharacterized protein (TIGR02391 family)